MTTDHLSPKQQQIISLIFKFRFLTTFQIQRFLGHQKPQRIQTWLKDLSVRGYLARHYSRQTFWQASRPAVYFLGKKAIPLSKSPAIFRDDQSLRYIYTEAKRSQKFIDHCLTLADICLRFITRLEASEKLAFLTRGELQDFDYLPQPLPDAYLAVIKDGQPNRRYFLDLFDPYTPPFVGRRRIRQYLDYAERPAWPEDTNNPLPAVLFILPHPKMENHLLFYTRARLKYASAEPPHFYFVTKDQVLTLDAPWQKAQTIPS